MNDVAELWQKAFWDPAHAVVTIWDLLDHLAARERDNGWRLTYSLPGGSGSFWNGPVDFHVQYLPVDPLD